MSIRNVCWLYMFVSAVASPALAEETTLPYVLMNEDLSELKSDFNDAVDQVRLVFIVGPT